MFKDGWHVIVILAKVRSSTSQGKYILVDYGSMNYFFLQRLASPTDQRKDTT